MIGPANEIEEGESGRVVFIIYREMAFPVENAAVFGDPGGSLHVFTYSEMFCRFWIWGVLEFLIYNLHYCRL